MSANCTKPCSAYATALSEIESFSVDDNNRVALKMGEIAREALNDESRPEGRLSIAQHRKV